MNTSLFPLLLFFLAVSILESAACGRTSSADARNLIVGTWLVKDSAAPFPYHMYVFNADGTMQQANPDAGDPHTSDSDGKGVWVTDGDEIKGKWMEIIADRATHRFAGRVEVSFSVKVRDPRFTGVATAKSFDADNKLTEGPTSPGPLEGTRVVLP